MDMKLQPFNFAQAAARAGLRPDGSRLSPTDDVGQPLGVQASGLRVPSVSPSSGESFKVSISQALKDVSASQLEAQRLQRELQLDNPNVSVEETMMAMQKAQVGFQAALSVRNRLVQAYTDIMNMPV